MSGDPRNQLQNRIEMLSWLETIVRNFDPPLLMGRARFNEAEGWVWIWLLRSLFGAKYEKMPEEKVNGFLRTFSSRWQTWFTYIGLIGIAGVPQTLGWEMSLSFSGLAYGAIVISFIFSLIANLNRMLTMGDPYLGDAAGDRHSRSKVCALCFREIGPRTA